tara:strand:- start:1654 stop:1878 length:225 start_codon:yes stop_codon:yes gene_type:complete
MSREKPIEVKIGKSIKVFPEMIYKAKVIKSGNGASIKSYKKYLGMEAIVIVKTPKKLTKKEWDEYIKDYNKVIY